MSAVFGGAVTAAVGSAVSGFGVCSSGTPGEVKRWLEDWTMGFTEKGLFAKADSEHVNSFLSQKS